MTDIQDRRDIMANQLLMRGRATMLELLAVSFGEWPPKGLDVRADVAHGQAVDLRKIGGKSVMGMATAPQDTHDGRWMKLNPQLISAKGHIYSTMGHEMIHLLQGDYSFRLQKSLFGKIKAAIAGQSVASEDIMEEITERPENPISRQFNILSLPLDKQMGAFQRHDILRRGSEIQARLHQILIDGYQCWGKLPATTDEFHAAMKGAGFALPAHIETHLQALPATSSIRDFMKGDGMTPASASVKREIDTVVNALTDDSRKDFWNNTALRIYADLIEMYGDSRGRERFGLGQNPKAGIPAKRYPGGIKAATVAPSA